MIGRRGGTVVADDVLKLAPLLDRVGSVVGLTNWVRGLYYEERILAESAQVVRRMDALLKRLEKGKSLHAETDIALVNVSITDPYGQPLS